MNAMQMDRPADGQKLLPGLRAVWVSLVLFVAASIFTLGAQLLAQSYGMSSQHLESYCRWDCTWYASIIDSGYYLHPDPTKSGRTNWPFFPLFPLLASGVKRLLGLPTSLALVLSSRAAFFTAILSFLVLVRDELDDLSSYFLAGALVAFNPYMIYAQSGYTETLYFTLCALGFWLLEQQRWLGAGAMGALLSATRVQGSLFAVPYLIAALRQGDWRALPRNRTGALVVGLLLCPLGLLLFAGYLHYRIGDALAFVHALRAFGGMAPSNPVSVLLWSLHRGRWFAVKAVVALVGLAAAAWLLKLRRWEMGMFLLLAVLMPLSGTVRGMPRYLCWQPPFLYAIFLLLRQCPALAVLYFVFAAGNAALMVLGWFSGVPSVT